MLDSFVYLVRSKIYWGIYQGHMFFFFFNRKSLEWPLYKIGNLIKKRLFKNSLHINKKYLWSGKGARRMCMSYKNICMFWCIPDAGNTIFDKDRVLIYHDIFGTSFLFITSENLIVIFWCFRNLTVSNYHFLFPHRIWNMIILI